MLRRPAASAIVRACAVTFRLCSGKSSAVDDALSSLLDELDQCELASPNAKTTSTPDKVNSSSSAVGQPAAQRISRPEKTEVLRQLQLKKLIYDADQELEFLKTEQRRTSAQAAIGSLTPAQSSDHFFTGSEQVLEKSPQHFLASEESEKELEKLPPLRHSGSVAVVTIVGKVIKTTSSVSPGEGTTLFLEYDIPVECRDRKGVVAAVTYSPTLCAFVRTNVEVGDIVHVLGQLVPPSENGVAATILIPHNGGSVSTLLRARK